LTFTFFLDDDRRDDNELISSFDEIPPSDVGDSLRRDIVPNEKNERDLFDDEPVLGRKGPDPNELDAPPIVTLPITTAPAVFGLNCGIGVPSDENTATKR
jgi:hypothetical protein